jgi:hypothetical protein
MAYLPTMFESRWPGVILTGIIIANSIITVSDTAGLHPKQKVALSAIGQTTTNFTVHRVLSDTQLQVITWSETQTGAGLDQSIQNPVAFSGGTLTASEDGRNKIGYDIVLRAVYDNEPSTALRNVLVNKYGAYYDATNPLPVAFDGTIEVGDVSIVQGGNTMVVNPDGSINVDATIAATIPSKWTEIDLSYDSNNNLIGVQYLDPAVEQTLTLSYDSNNNLTKVVASE